jgi:hypothetical protein
MVWLGSDTSTSQNSGPASIRGSRPRKGSQLSIALAQTSPRFFSSTAHGRILQAGTASSISCSETDMLKTLAVACLRLPCQLGSRRHIMRGISTGTSQAVPWANRQLRHALAVRRPITVRCSVERGNGATPTKPARCEKACHAR